MSFHRNVPVPTVSGVRGGNGPASLNGAGVENVIGFSNPNAVFYLGTSYYGSH